MYQLSPSDNRRHLSNIQTLCFVYTQKNPGLTWVMLQGCPPPPRTHESMLRECEALLISTRQKPGTLSVSGKEAGSHLENCASLQFAQQPLAPPCLTFFSLYGHKRG